MWVGLLLRHCLPADSSALTRLPPHTTNHDLSRYLARRTLSLLRRDWSNRWIGIPLVASGRRLLIMRVAGTTLLLLGYAWMVGDCVLFFGARQYGLAHLHIGRLAELPTIRREAAARELTDLALELQDSHRILLIPGSMMLVGGLILGVTKKVGRPPHTPA